MTLFIIIILAFNIVAACNAVAIFYTYNFYKVSEKASEQYNYLVNSLDREQIINKILTMENQQLKMQSFMNFSKLYSATQKDINK